MADLEDEAREHLEADMSLDGTSGVDYYHTHQVSRLPSWKQNSQQVVGTSLRHGLMETRQDIFDIKNDPENLSRFYNTINSLPVQGGPGPSFPSCETSEDKRLKGQLLQEITRVAESFDPYSNTSVPTSTGCRNYALGPEFMPTSEADYTSTCTSSDPPQWMWMRNTSDERNFTCPNSSNLLVGFIQGSEAGMTASLQCPTSSQLITDPFSSSLPLIDESDPSSSISASAMIPQTQQGVFSMSSSALDLSPSSPIQTSPTVRPQTSLVHSRCSSSSSRQLLGTQNIFDTFDGKAQEEMTYPLNLERNLNYIVMQGSNEEDPDDVTPCQYPDEVAPCQQPDDVAPCQPDNKCESCHADLKDQMQCSNCNLVAKSVASHKGDKVLLAAGAKKKTASQKQTTKDQSYSCKQCGEIFSRPEKLKIHEIKHSGERPYRCDECSASFSKKNMLARHKKVHTGEKPYSCVECKTSFTESGSLKVHMRLHTGQKPYKCEWCDEGFSGAGILASHKRKHTGEKPYVCKDCGTAFRLLSTLKSHERRHTGEKPFSCDLCGSSFTQKGALRRHKRMHLNIKPFSCEQCGLKFREKETLRKHMQLHKIKFPYTCDICGAGFNYVKRLENHKMRHNGGDRPFQCSKCPSSFSTPKYLSQHKKRVHDRKGSIKCEECNATFNRRESFRSHLRIHSGGGQYVCAECGASFNQRATLTRHMRHHKGKGTSVGDSSKGDFTCQMCTLVFHSKTSLENHTIECHVEGDLIYECSICYSRFSDQVDLIKHKKLHHPSNRPLPVASVDNDDDITEPVKDKYICEDCEQTFFRKRQLRAHRKFCLCKDLDIFDYEPEAKPTILSNPNLKKEPTSPVKLVSAALAATSKDSVTGVNFETTASFESSPLPTSMCVVPSSTLQLSSEHDSPAERSLSHSNMYEQQHMDQVHQNLSSQQQNDENFHQSSNMRIMQSLQDSLHNPCDNPLQLFDKQPVLHEKAQESFAQQHPLQGDQHPQSFSFDMSQQLLHKCMPSVHAPSHHHHSHSYEHSNNLEPQLLSNAVFQSISQDLDGHEDLQLTLQPPGDFAQNRKTKDRKNVYKQQQLSCSDVEEYETDSFHPENLCQNSFPRFCNSGSLPSHEKLDEKHFFKYRSTATIPHLSDK